MSTKSTPRTSTTLVILLSSRVGLVDNPRGIFVHAL